jgi:hypothetical protein
MTIAAADHVFASRQTTSFATSAVDISAKGLGIIDVPATKLLVLIVSRRGVGRFVTPAKGASASTAGMSAGSASAPTAPSTCVRGWLDASTAKSKDL